MMSPFLCNRRDPSGCRRSVRVKSMRPPIILLGSDCLTALQIARILWRRGVPVFGIADRPTSAYCRSRAVVGTFEDQGEAGLYALLDELRADYDGPPIILPCTDRSVAWLANAVSGLSGKATVLMPSGETLDQLADKVRFHEYAIASGWRVPQTWILRDLEGLTRVASEIPVPFVVKPPRRTPAWRDASGDRKVCRFDDRESFVREAPSLLEAAGKLVVQAWIAGPPSTNREFTALYDADGSFVTSVVLTKLRQWPTEIGTSSLAREVRDDEVSELAQSMLAPFSFAGLVQIEFKRDEKTGELFLIEMNPGRATLNQPLCEAAGVEMTWAWYCAAAGQSLPRALEISRPGAGWVCWKRDLRSAFAGWRRGDLTLREWGASYRGIFWSADVCLDDPLPLLLDFFRKSRSILRRRVLGNREASSAGRSKH